MDAEHYIRETLGLPCQIASWDGTASLPLFLANGRTFSKLTIDNTSMLIASGEAHPFSITRVTADASRLEQRTDLPIVFQFPRLSAYQRKALIQNHVPFIVPGTQLYIPSLGMVFTQRISSRPLENAQDIEVRPFSPATQLVWLYLLYSNESKIQSDIARALQFTEAQVSVAVTLLEQLAFVHRTKQGRSNSVELLTSRQTSRLDLLKSSWHLLKSPIFSKYTVTNRNRQMIADELIPAGEFALSRRTQLATPKLRIYAVERHWLKQHNKELCIIDPALEKVPDNAYILELWRYDPRLLAQYTQEDYLADPISTALTLGEIADERLEDAIQESIRNTFSGATI